MKVTKTSKTTYQTADNRFSVTDNRPFKSGDGYRLWDNETKTGKWFRTVTAAKQYIESCY